MRRRSQTPLLPAAVACLAGALVGRAGVEAPPVAAVAIGAAAGLAAWRGSARLAGRAAVLGLAVVALVRAGPAGGVAGREPSRPPSAQPLVAFEGCLRGRGDGGRGRIVEVRPVDGGPVARLRLRHAGFREYRGGSPGGPERATIGDRIRVDGRLRAVAPPQNPGERDRARADREAGVDGELVAAGPPRIVGRCGGLDGLLARGRTQFRRLVDRTLPPREAGLAAALVTGEVDGVDAGDLDALRATGTVHVLSISGLHLAWVAAAAFGAFRRLSLRLFPRVAETRDLRLPAAAAALAAATAYAAFAGMGIATSRALLVTASAVAAMHVGGAHGGWNAWALGLAVLTLAEPSSIERPAFALSFLATGGLLSVAGGRRGRESPVKDGATLVRAWRRMPAAVERGLRATFAAAVATLPATGAWFGRWPVVGLVANAAAIPLFGAGSLLPLLAAALAQPLCEPVARGLVLSAYPALAAGRFAVDAGSRLPYASIERPLSVGQAIALGTAVAAWLLLRGGTRRVAVAAAILATVAQVRSVDRPPRRTTAAFLSVGQGDAAVVRFATGEVLVVDTGPPGAGARVLVPYLRSAGVRRIDAVAISHAHPDHTGGLEALARAFPVGQLWIGGPVGADRALLAGVAQLSRRGTRAQVVGRGAPAVRIGAATIEFVGGDATRGREEAGDRSRRNDRSLVLRVSEPGLSVLFAGDLERAGEAILVESSRRLRADVVKIPHHGSGTGSSAELVARTRPRLAVASLGAGNRYGFPDADVVARWERAKAVVLRTDLVGAIEVRGCEGEVGVPTICVRTPAGDD